MNAKRQIRGGRSRFGGAIVEMALITPLLMTMLFGIIEYGWVFSVKQGLTNAAREGCRVATLQGSTDEDIRATIDTYLQSMGLSTETTETIIERATPDNPVERVTIRVRYAQISLLGGFFGNTNWTIGSTCTMRKEGAG